MPVELLDSCIKPQRSSIVILLGKWSRSAQVIRILAVLQAQLVQVQKSDIVISLVK